MRFRHALIVAALLLPHATSVRHGFAAPPLQEGGPKVGDPAPELRVSEWIKGEPISRFERGQVYVVEFWATWCIACIYSMPHLSDIQQKYKDQGVTVIAVNVMEEIEEDSFDVPGNVILPKEVFSRRAIAERYVRKIDAHVAIDADTKGENAGVMAKAWLGEDRAIPRCLIVDRDRKVAWIGHPMRVDGPLAAVVAGTYDAEKQRTIDSEFARLDSELGKALLAKEWKQAMQVLDQLKAVDPISAPQNFSNRIKCLIGMGEYRAAHEFAESSAGDTRDRFVQGLIAYELFQAPADHRDLDLVVKIATEAAQDDHFFSMQVLWKVLEVKGDKPALIALLKRLLEFDPRNTVVAKRLQELKAKVAEGTDPSPASNPPRVPDGPSHGQQTAADAEPPLLDAAAILRSVTDSTTTATSLHVGWTRRDLLTPIEDGGNATPMRDTTSHVDVRIDRPAGQFSTTEESGSRRLLCNGWFYAFSSDPAGKRPSFRSRWPKSIEDLVEQNMAVLDGKRVLLLSGWGEGVPAWLLRTDNHRYFGHLHDLRYLDRTNADGDTPVDRITFRDSDNHQWELWVTVSTPRQPVCVMRRTIKKVLVEGGQDAGPMLRDMTDLSTWKFDTWELSATHPANTFAPPEEAEQCEEGTIRPGPHTLVGEQAADFALHDLTGAEVRLASLRGRVVVIDFWFLACGHCIVEMPELMRAVNAHGPQDAVLLTINSHDPPDEVMPFLAKKEWTELRVLFDPDHQAAATYRVVGWPTTVVVDRQARIRFAGATISPLGKAEFIAALQAAVEDGRPAK